ncbi:unnamed protein product [Linum trigynum]|uniref:Uncharacterized protein n=1 Tax=Linum trigynum TaxID=586398 RepID=A0AAV2E901_9ROSI
MASITCKAIHNHPSGGTSGLHGVIKREEVKKHGSMVTSIPRRASIPMGISRSFPIPRKLPSTNRGEIQFGVGHGGFHRAFLKTMCHSTTGAKEKSGAHGGAISLRHQRRMLKLGSPTTRSEVQIGAFHGEL